MAPSAVVLARAAWRQPAARRPGAYPGPVPKVPSWLRAHPGREDGLLAVVLFALSGQQLAAGQTGDDGRLAYIAITAILAITVLGRRRHPVAAFTVAVVIGAAQIVFGLEPQAPAPVFALQPSNTDGTILVLLYALAASRPRRISVAGLVICLIGSAVAIARWSPAHHPYAGAAVLDAAVGLGGMTLAAWVLGDSVAYRDRRARYAALEERAARLEAAERARELGEKRARVVDESVATLRRIERDLHDGAQVRLTALAMTLGEIREGLGPSGAGDGIDAEAADLVRMLVSTAHAGAKETLAELRDLARGIHPAVLDRGLGAALAALADTAPLPVTVSVRVARRPSPAIETIAYFCAAEVLANVAKHSSASQAAIIVGDEADRLLMTITDDGTGGARPAPGSGLAGLLERVQTVDGHLTIDSPPGGPTTVTIELPARALCLAARAPRMIRDGRRSGPDGDGLEAAQDKQRAASRWSGERKPRVAAGYFLEGDAAFEAGQRCAEAVVDPERERQVA